ncbi:MAG: alkaline phosphatase family protein, partial [Verrucomicrobia bacterium]|nr:alkaline phosphatase family protein [Verrucomicrobiota bacterium]
MNQRLAVLNVVGLTGRILGAATPRITDYARRHPFARIDPALPAVTCSAQSTYLTGLTPAAHGAVANGWYDRELGEVQFWKQSNHLVRGKKLWESLRESAPGFTCAKLFWWYNMFSTADYSITPRPMYPADGRKVFDIYAWPYDIRSAIKRDLGDFPFAGFWGPAAGVASPAGGPDCATRWIAASAKWIEEKRSPHLSLVYLPHLDYNLQRWGPDDPRIQVDLRMIDDIVGDLLDFYERRSVRVALLSEYGITGVSRPVALNRAFR